MIRKGHGIAKHRYCLAMRRPSDFRIRPGVRAMFRSFLSLFLLLFAIAASVDAGAAEPQILWPQGWKVESLSADAPAPGTYRQRATKSDLSGNALMVMELTVTPVAADHQPNLQGVLLEMRKSLQKDFFQGGYQSVCNKIHASVLGGLTALETTCTITQNGRHVLSQTLVMALSEGNACVLSYAGQAQVYVESQDEIQSVRNSLKL
jgi:hypothetical protein